MDVEETRNQILANIDAHLSRGVSESGSRLVLNLCEAYAWLTVPGVPHGGSAAKSG